MSSIYSVNEELSSTATTAVDYDGAMINETIYSLDEAPVLTERASIKALILAVLAGTSILANSATLLSIAISRKSNKSSSSSSSTLYTLLFQLAVADLLVSIWCLSGEAAWTYTVEWKGGEILCKIFKFSQVFSLYLSTSTMILIGFDRLLAIKRPINHRACIRPIGIAWITSALLASPQLAVFRVLEGPFREPFYQCVTYGFYTEEWQEQLYSIFSLLTMFILPLITLISCYVCIFYTIAKEKERSVLSQRRESGRRNTTHSSNKNLLNGSSSRPLHHRANNKESHNSGASAAASSAIDHHRQDIFQRAKMKSLRISVIIVTAFVICWAPYYFMMITFIFLKPDEKLGEEMQSAIFFFGMSNSLINPLIYGAFHLCSRPDRRAGPAQHQQQILRFHPGSASFFFSRMRTNNNNRGLRMIADDFHHHPAGHHPHHQNNALIIPGAMMQMDLADTSSRSSSISQQQRCSRSSPASVTTCV